MRKEKKETKQNTQCDGSAVISTYFLCVSWNSSRFDLYQYIGKLTFTGSKPVHRLNFVCKWYQAVGNGEAELKR